MSMEEIEKLRLKVEKDPNSRLFLPLAEEYRKSGMLDEAITVVLRGLEFQPGYTSARVALGRLYLEKNMIEEARSEFEDVVKTIPDNLFSHKKLAEIYRGRGDVDMAIREYKKVIELNPLDDDARISLEEVEGEVGGVEEILPPEPPAEVAPATEEKNADIGGDFEKEIAEEVSAETPLDVAFEEFAASFSPGPETESDETKDSLEAASEAEVSEDSGESSNADSTGEAVLESEAEETDFLELSEEDEGFEEAFAVDSAEEASEIAIPVSETTSAGAVANGHEDISAADSFIAEGDYFRAMEVYRKILSADPENARVLQRVSELKALLKVLGRGDELIVARLDAFLGAIKKNFEREH